MGFTITGGGKDGPNAVNVTDTGLLQTSSVSENALVFISSQAGNSYTITASSILTGDATTSALLYIKNNATSDLSLKTLSVSNGVSASGAGGILITPQSFVDTGTIVTNAVDGNAFNLNLGNAATLFPGDVFAGVEGDTITGTSFAALMVDGTTAGTLEYNIEGIIVPPGGKIAVSVTTPAGNTSVFVGVGISGYFRSLEPS